MRRFARIAVLVTAALLAAGAAAAEDAPGTIARVDYWTIKAGTTADFEKGLKAHNALHAKQADPHALLTWQVLTGKRVGQYLRGSFGHHWADFDVDAETRAADDADSAVNLDPYIVAADPGLYHYLPDWSRTKSGAAGPAPLSQVLIFHVEFGRSPDFARTVGKIHAALSKIDWPDYRWYQLADGGEIPTYVLSLPRENWAAYEPQGDLASALVTEYGEEGAAEIFRALAEVVKEQIAYTVAYRADLSYLPAAD